jgi:hypothetical protein
MDWAAWHQYYDDPASPLNARLFTFRADYGGRPGPTRARIDSIPADHETVGPNGGQEA